MHANRVLENYLALIVPQDPTIQGDPAFSVKGAKIFGDWAEPEGLSEDYPYGDDHLRANLDRAPKRKPKTSLAAVHTLAPTHSLEAQVLGTGPSQSFNGDKTNPAHQFDLQVKAHLAWCLQARRGNSKFRTLRKI